VLLSRRLRHDERLARIAARFGFCGSKNVRAVIPSGPKISSRSGEASQCSLSPSVAAKDAAILVEPNSLPQRRYRT
jgi:hypothetical protein